MKFRLVFFTLVAVLLLGCREQTSQQKLSRIEQVDQLPFRSLNVSDSLSNELLETSRYLYDLIENSAIEEGLLALWNEESLGFQIIDIEKESLQVMRNKSYECWKDDDIKLSVLLYKSSSVDVHTNSTEEFYVLELEHKSLTGTFFVFVSLDSQFTSSYVDRN